MKWHETGEAKECSEIECTPIGLKSGNRIWGYVNYKDAMKHRAQQEDSEMETLSRIYGVFSLPQDERTGRRWCYTPELGFHKPVAD